MFGSQDLFDSWMNKQSDLVQRLGISYGENLVNQAFNEVIDQADPEVIDSLKDLQELYLLDCIKRDKAWLIENRFLTKATARKLTQQWEQSCQTVANNIDDYVEAFGVPDLS